MDMSRYKKIFMEESRDHLATLSQLSLDLEKDPDNMEVVNTIFREAHSIKGMAASMGYIPISELTHKVEDLMDLVRKGEVTASARIVDVLLKSIDVLEAQLETVNEGKELDEGGLKEILELIAEVASESPTETDTAPEDGDQGEKAEGSREETGETEDVSQKSPPVFTVVLQADREAKKPHIKILQGVKKLSELGRVMGLVPGLSELKKGLSNGEVRVNLVTGAGEEDIRRLLEGLPGIPGFKIQRKELDISPEEPAPEGPAPEIDVPGVTIQEEVVPEGPAPEKGVSEKSEAVKEKEPDEEKKVQEGAPSIEEMLPTGEALSVLQRSVRISTALLESFINLVGELLITKSSIHESTKGLGDQGIDESVNRLEYLIRELHAKVITVRMMPLESILSRMPRLVRDLAKEKEKEVDFSVNGGEIELDRSILEELTDPLVHIIRNAIDHGLEPPEVREGLNKPRRGSINLNAYRERDLVIIEVSDDGKGMNSSRIKESAISREVITKSQAELLSEKELLLLTFMPNLSTAEKITDISGRGVGMDVVKTKVESLGGSINLESERGKGTKVILILPLTVAIIQALLIKSAGETFALPISKIVKSAEVDPGSIQKSQNQRVVLLNEEMIPLFNLDVLLGLKTERKEKDIIPLVVMEARGKLVGIEVDEISGSQEIFIKSLGYPLEKIPGFSGVTILGDGSPVLILDVINLF